MKKKTKAKRVAVTGKSDAANVQLRDYFAAKVMQATVADVIKEIGCKNAEPVRQIREMCKCAYGIADAMLSAREAKP